MNRIHKSYPSKIIFRNAATTTTQQHNTNSQSKHKMRRIGKNTRKPKGFEIIEPTLEAIENELRDKVKESNVGLRNTESMWPVMQIGWQRSRYIYDMYYTYKRIPKEVYDFCIKHKLADAALIAKWKKPGYERLCSTYVINPSNYKFGTVSICRVPLQNKTEEQRKARDPTTGCLGCASGKDAAPRNIFGNKYGQNLAAVQIARERRMMEIHTKVNEEVADTKPQAREYIDPNPNTNTNTNNTDAQKKEEDDDDTATDDDDTDDEDDYGPAPPSGIWAGSQKLEEDSQDIVDDDTQDNSKKRMRIS